MSQKPIIIPDKEKPMCQLTELPPSVVLAMTKEAIVDAMYANVERSVPSQIEYEEHEGKLRPVRHVQPITDAYGVLKRSTEILHSYYETGEVDVITVTEMDALGKITGGHRLKHYTDRTQPEMLPLEEDGELMGEPGDLIGRGA